MILKIIIAIIVIIAAIFIYAATKPDNFRIERRIIINAAPDTIFPLINNFHQWMLWSPWENIDPALQRQYSGATAGVGATYEWKGNNKVGSGRMQIVKSDSPSNIYINLDFFEPFKAQNNAEFTLVSHDQATEVIWVMSGKNMFISKVMSVFCDMDKMIGKNFEDGLLKLKMNIEKSPTP